MTDILNSVMQISVTSVMNLLIYIFLSKLYKPEYKNKLIYCISYIFTTLAFTAVNKLTEIIGISVLNFFYGFAYIHIICWLLFERDYKKTFMYNSLYIIALMFADILTVISLSLMKGETIVDIADNPHNRIISCSVYIFFMILVCFIFLTILNKSNIAEIRTKQIILLSAFTLFETFSVDSYAIEIDSKSPGGRLVLIILGFLALNIYMVYFINKISKIHQQKYEYNLIQCQNEIQLEHYMEINQKYEESRKVLHDIRKHLSIISDIQSTDAEKAREYELMIENKVDSLFTRFHCSNNILSAVMSQKISEAETRKIKVTTQVEDINFDFIDNLDMTAIFANLWDNAIEACKKVDEPDRFINVIIGQINDFIIICFENSFNGKIKSKHGNILSSKDKHEGLGISIIKSSIAKYSGTITINHENNIFKAEALMPIQ